MSTATGRPPAIHPALADGLSDCRRAFWGVALFSAAFNVLMLAGPLYMMQVYDRVLSSRSIPTLLALTALLVGAYAFQAGFDLLRSRIVLRAASLLDHNLGTTVHGAVVRIAVQNRSARDPAQPVRDLDQIRSFLTSTGPIAFVDMPWMPIFLAACFFLHPVLGLTAAAGGLMLVTMAFLTHRRTGRSAKDLAQFAGLRAAGVEADRRNSETVIAMGMGATLAGRWRALNERYLEAVERAGEVAGTFGSISKALRLLLQSAMLGMGAFLVIEGEMSAGAMMAASVMMGRALAPIETTIANWKGFTQARQSMRRLSDILSRLPADRSPTELPAPCRSLSVEHVTVGAPGSSTALVNDVSFSLAAGEALGIIGPSGIGKTSLVRAMVGIWPVARGSVRLDGARLDQWDPTVLGRHIGFVSQNVDLFDGTIAENIARMAESPDSQAVVAAAQAAGAHDMILRMAKGYDTPIGDGGAVLSGGQRQRIALARALYGDPFVLVLDEAGSNLDNEGENALMAAIRAVKARKGIVVTVAHRPSALSACDKVLLLGAGGQPVFGPRDEILKKIGLAPAAPANLKVVQAVPAGADR